LQWGHAGAFSQGARSVVCLLPEHSLSVIVLSNAFPTPASQMHCARSISIFVQGQGD
jgi:hypothetical protein